ncbi:PadR family transcriptional regulator [Tardiphaga sp.]|jgi:PadR family transcriptional regulator PadR|uniref:PadR family transcriptional regulator n=1 Tax=Tardiphaga sp. TaxID=1926292 RepID=UPI0037D99D14
MDITLKDNEQIVMIAIMRKNGEAYGVSIFEDLAKRLGREVPMATIYATLEKLESKGFVKSRKGEATAERGGRAKMYFELTGTGQKVLNASVSGFNRLIEGLDWKGAMA